MSYKNVMDRAKAAARDHAARLIREGYSNEDIRKEVRAVHKMYFDDLRINAMRRKIAKEK